MKTAIILTTLAAITKIGQLQGCSCPENWVYRTDNRQCYFSSTGINGSVTDTYQGARHRCHGDGGDLVVIEDDLEVGYVKNLRKESPTYYWIGLCRPKGEATFFDLYGNSPVNLAGILSAPPEYVDVAVMTNAERWTDANPSSSHYYVCKKDSCTNPIRGHICPWEEIGPRTSFATTQASSLTKTAMLTTDDMTSSTTYNPATTENDNGTTEPTTFLYMYIWIGVGIAAFLVLLLVVFVIVLILLRKRKKRKANGIESFTNNLDMTKTGTNKSVPINRKSAENTVRTNNAIYEECRYAEVDHRPDNTASNTAMTAKDVVYEDAVAVHIGVASKQDTNDVALYATPVRATRTVDKENGGHSSEEDHTEIVENIIYGE